MRLRLFIFCIFSLITVVQFQNCSQVSGELSSASLAIQPEARISDDWRNADLVFSYQALETAEDLNSTSFYGLCKRQALTKPLSWKLSEEGQTFLQGSSSCVHGNFAVVFSQLQEVPCGTLYKLSIQDPSAGTEASMMIVRRCPAIQSAVESNGCYRERILTRNGNPSCEYICYDRGIVIQKEPLGLDQCPAATP